MEKGSKILLGILFSLSILHARAQTEVPIQPFFNPLIVNPAFAGLDKVTSFQTGNQYLLADSASSYNLFYATYDTYSDKLKGGIAFYFQQGIIGNRNISTTELGFAYAGIPKKTKSGMIRVGLNANLLVATKQKTVAVLDKVMLDAITPANPPGVYLFRYAYFKPRVSLLWDMQDLIWGVSFGSSLKKNFSDKEDLEIHKPFNASFYFSKTKNGFRKGLHSRPFNMNTEVMLYYTDEYLLGRLNVFTEFKKNTLGVFMNGNFKSEVYTVGGIGGLATGNFRFNLATGAAYCVATQKIGFTGELSLILKVPQFDYSKFNPWQPQ